MPVYISKKAITHNPLPIQELGVSDSIYSPLTSLLLNGVDYLNKLVRNDLNIKPLQEGNPESTYEAVWRIQLALEVIDYYNGTDYEIPGGPFISKSGQYDSQLRNAVLAFQDFAEIPENGIIDAYTLSQIDAHLSLYENAVVDTNNIAFVGESLEKNVEVVEEESGGSFSYAIKINGEDYFYVSNAPLSVNPIINVLQESSDFRFKLADPLREELVEQNPITIEYLENIEFATIPYSKIQFIGSEGTTVNDAFVSSQIDIIPPQILGPGEANLYRVKPGDNLTDIVLDNYYGVQEDIINPHNGSVIFSLPTRSPSANADRDDDARLQFYLNLLYYYNIKVDETTTTEYGIEATGGYQLYDDNDLSNYNMHNNAFDIGTPQSVLPNYHRFLSALATTSGTEIVFGTDGKATSFQMNSSKYIWIPSRKFADGLYYSLNFRHSEMLNETGTGFNYVTAGELDTTITEMEGTSFWGTLSSWLKSEIGDLYRETLEFHQKMYEFAIDTLTEEIPRGAGLYFDGSIGVTWGYPIATDITTRKSFWRKMTPVDELTFVLREEVEAFVGVDAAVGFSAGFKIGSGKKGKKMGLNVGAGIEAGIVPKVLMEYEFPIRPEETGLISFILSMTSIGKILGDLMGVLNVINTSPSNYLTWMQLGVASVGRAWGAAQFSVNDAGDPVSKNNVTSPEETANPSEEAKTNSFLSVQNILNKIPSLGISASGELSLGLEFDIRSKYDDKPLIPEKDGRVPSEVEVEVLHYVQGSMTTTGIGSVLGAFFVTTIPGLSGLFGLLNFDRGIGIGLGYKFTRSMASKDITFNDTDLAGATVNSSGTGPNLQYNGTSWESTIAFASFTGNVDRLCFPGTEAMIKLDANKVYQIIQSHNSSNPYPFDNLTDILEIFHSFSYKYKQGLGFNSHTRKTLDGELFGTLIGNTMASGVTKDFLTTARSGKPGFDVYAGIDVSLEFLIDDIANVLKFYFKKLYLTMKFKIDENDPVKGHDFKKELQIKYHAIIRTIAPGSNDQILDTECYQLLYTELNNYIDSEYASDLTLANFKETFKHYARINFLFNNYLFNNKSPQMDENSLITVTDISPDGSTTPVYEDIGVYNIINVLAMTATLLNASVGVEAKLGGSFAGRIKAGLEATVRLSGSLAAGVIGELKLLEDGEFVELLPNDPYLVALNSIKTLLDTSTSGSRKDGGLRKSLTVLPKS